MAEPIEPVRNFVLHIEKTLTTRRLYTPNMAPYQEAHKRLFEKCRAAAGQEGFTLRIGPTDLFLGKSSLLNRTNREEAFFFPLYRDGLRELTFSPDATEQDLDSLLTTFEAEEKRSLAPDEDCVVFLWRRALSTITYSAIDGIGDQEGEEEGPDRGKDDYHTLVAELVEKIKNPAPAMVGQSYAFVLDADVRVSSTDLGYQATTTRKAFEENPTVLRLTPEEVSSLRAEVGGDREGALIDRFIELLFLILGDPAREISGESVISVFQTLLEGYRQASDYPSLCRLLARLRAAAEVAPDPTTRRTARDLLAGFLTAERIQASFEAVERGALRFETAATLWDLAGDEIWDQLIDFASLLSEGEIRTALLAFLRRRLARKPDLLRGTLGASRPERVRVGLLLTDEHLEPLYAKELLALACHGDEAIRLKSLSAAGRIGGRAALEVLWKAMEGDPAKPVRLLAFRLIASSNLPGLPERLKALVTGGGFSSRPLWEREKYVRLLATVAGDSVRPLFESWIPTKRWFWKPADFERAELAVRGLAACGASGLEEARALAARGGKVGGTARGVLETLTQRDLGETAVMRPVAPSGRPAAHPRVASPPSGAPRRGSR